MRYVATTRSAVLAAGLAMLAACAVEREPAPAGPREEPVPASAPSAAPARDEKSPAGCGPARVFAREDQAFLDDLERRICEYFWTEIYPETGIAIDHTENRVGKVAATGFGLAAICIGVERGWIGREEGYERVWKTLNAFWDDPDDPDDAYVDGKFGLFWHFVDGRTGRMKPIDCVAPCDSADFIAGVVVAGEYFKGTPVEELARRIYDAVEWDQFVARHADGRPGLMSFGWVPLHVSDSYYETDGLLDFNMSGFADNSLLIYVLALGSDTHPIPQETWDEYVDSYTLDDYSGYECVMTGQLFCRQVPQAFVPFERKRDRKIDYWLDTVNAILADRIFNMRVNGYPPQVWGLTDCFGKESYTHGAPPGPISNDGTVGSTAFAGALPHVPDLSMEAMKYVRTRFGDRVYGRYGFTSSVNLNNGFVSPLYVGIELGPMVQLLENARSGLIWELFGRTAVMSNFVRRAAMCGVVDDFELPPEAPLYGTWSAEDAELVRGDDQPQHGRQCLEIHPALEKVRLTCRLPENDLMRYHFAQYLSVWARDLAVEACLAEMDGTVIELEKEGQAAGQGWEHLYWRLPAHGATSRLCGLRFVVSRTGGRPALDNMTLEEEADVAPPDRVTGLSAAPGAQGGSVTLKWKVPADRGGGIVDAYVLEAQPSDGEGAAVTTWLSAVVPAGGEETRTVLLESGRRYGLRMAALDLHGHRGEFSDPVEATANPSPVVRTAYHFEDGRLDGWSASGSNMALRIDGDGGGGKCLRVEFTKNHAWNHLIAQLDPEMVALHRYLRVRAKGKVELLGKIWSRDDLQQDMEARRSESDETWTTLVFDTRKAQSIRPDRDRVSQLILFPEPGRWQGEGVFWLDDLEYADR